MKTIKLILIALVSSLLFAACASHSCHTRSGKKFHNRNFTQQIEVVEMNEVSLS